jgi:hypothetical protein
MADAQIIKGGTPVINYQFCDKTASLYGPPFGHMHKPFTPPFDAHYEGEMGGKVTFAAGAPLIPGVLPWQAINLRAAKPVVGNVIQMIIVPVNHFIHYLRIDVADADTNLAGATVQFAGQWYKESATDPTVFNLSACTEIADAITAQSSAVISLAAQSTNFLSVALVEDDYVQPLYVKPQFVTVTTNGVAEIKRCQGGALILGVQIKSLPTNTKFSISDFAGSLYLTTRIEGFECPAFT